MSFTGANCSIVMLYGDSVLTNAFLGLSYGVSVALPLHQFILGLFATSSESKLYVKIMLVNFE